MRCLIALLVLSFCTPASAQCPIFSALATMAANSHARKMDRRSARHARSMDRKAARGAGKSRSVTLVRVYR